MKGACTDARSKPSSPADQSALIYSAAATAPLSPRDSGAQETQPLPDCNAPLEEEGADLIDDAGALADQPLAHAVQRLQVELRRGLGGDELHGRALRRLSDRFRIAEVVLLSLAIRPHVFGRHQPGIVA